MNKYLFPKIKSRFLVFFIFLFAFQINHAQCPTVPVSPQVICDAAGFNFGDLNAFATPSPGTSIRWYLNPTGGTPLPQNQLVQEGTYFAGNASSTCATRAPLTVDFAVNPTRQSLDAIFCSNEVPTIQSYIDVALAANIPMNGSVQIFSDFQLTMMLSSTIALMGNANYFIVFVDNAGCRSQIERASTAVFPSPTAPNPPALQQFCSDTNPTVGSLNAGTTNNFNWYENVDRMNNPIPPALLNTESLVDGQTYYVQADNFFCNSNAAAVMVAIDDPASAGTSNNEQYCEDNIPAANFDLFPLLGPTADGGGTWMGPIATTNGDQGSVNISGQAVGIYSFTYTVLGTGNCPTATATITLEILEVLSSGTESSLSPISFCVSQLPIDYDLTLLLDNEDAGGIWTQGATSMDSVVTSPIDLSSFLPGTYNFTYSQNVNPNPCPENSITVQVIVLEDTNAGNAITTQLCENDLAANSPYDLFNSLDGTQDNNSEIWTDSANNIVSSTIDINGFTVTGSPYTYTYTVDNGFCQDSEIISIEILPAPESGNYIGTPFVVCEDQTAVNSPYDLFNLLDGTQDTNGTWYAGSNSAGTAIANPIDLTLLGTGTFDFTYSVMPIGTCTDSDVTVTVIVNPLPNTGTPTPFTVCENDLAANSPLDLFNQLAGQDAGGIWSDDDATGALTGSMVDLRSLVVGNYSFSYSITDANGCRNFSTVTINLQTAPESGNYIGTPFMVCEDQTAANSPYDLFNLLGGTQDTNGTWYAGSTSTGTAIANPIDLTTLGTGTFDFTYSVMPIGTCTDSDVTVTVIVNPLPNTGTPTPFTVCENDLAANSPLDLFNQLAGQDAGGIWSDDDATGALTGSMVDLRSLVVGNYNFSYSITDANGCRNFSTVTINVLPVPESGNYIGIPFTVCEDQTAANSPYDLFNLLDGTQDTNGTWYAGSTSIGTAIANPIDLTTLGTGTFDFTYSVMPMGTCTDSDVTVTVIVNPLPNTGTPTPFTVCENDLAANSPLDLFNQLAGQDAGGIWSDDDATGALTGSMVDLRGLVVGNYNFSYSITDANGCRNFSTVTINVQPAPESGNYIGTPFTVCEDQTAVNSPYDLFNLLDVTQDTNGTWYAGSTSTGTTIANPIDLTTLGTGTFDFTYSVMPIGTCTDSDVTVTVIINDLANAGVASPFIVCENELATNSPLDLFNQLSGSNVGGIWSDDDATGALLGSAVDLIGLAIGNYNFTYTVNNGSCTDSETVLISIVAAPNAGTATNFEICLSDTLTGQTIDLFNQLLGNDSGGIWSDDDITGALTNSIVNISSLAAGTFNFTYTVSPSVNCSADVETVQVIINDISAPSATPIQDFCDQASVVDLRATGNGIIWYEDSALTIPLNNVDLLTDGEDYYGTQTDLATNCESNDSVMVTVNIFMSPNSGTAVPLTVCNDQNMVDLFTALDGSQDLNGSWMDTNGTGALNGNLFDAALVVNGSYDFEYLVTGTPPCTNASTLVTVSVVSPVNAGVDAILNICSDNGATDLFSLLGSSVTPGGTWSPSLASNTGVFDPLVDPSDTYTYTVINSCNSSTAEVLVTVTNAPDAGTDNSLTICVVDGTIDLLTQLGGTPDANGVWNPLLNSGTNIFDPTIDGSGTFTYTVAAIGPCAADAVATLTIQVNESPAPVIINSSIDFCATDNPIVMDLDVTVSGNMIFWYDAIDSTTPLSGTDILFDGASYFVTQTGTNGCESSERIEISVSINDVSTPNLSPDGELFCINDNPTLQQLTLNILEFDSSLNNVIWYSSIDALNALPLSTIMTDGTTYYAVILDSATGCESSNRLSVTVDLSACGNVLVPDGFSPNDDGVNDVFDIDNLDFLYPNFNIEFYNRYGNLVYEGNANTPRFNGFSNQPALLNDGELPVGVYYYILKYNDGTTKPSQGRIYLSR